VDIRFGYRDDVVFTVADWALLRLIGERQRFAVSIEAAV
jgi:hypothetical protein